MLGKANIIVATSVPSYFDLKKSPGLDRRVWVGAWVAAELAARWRSWWSRSCGEGADLDQVVGETPCPVQIRVPSRPSMRVRSQP